MGSKVKFLLTAGLALAGGALFAAPPQGRVALHTWATTAEFKDISVTDLRGTVLWKGLPNLAKAEKGNEGKWVIDGDVLRQTNEKGTQGATLAFGSKEWGDYVFRVKARKLSGSEGFILHVRELGPQQCIYANYGGWNNAQSGFETKGDYDFPTPMARATAAFETGRWYDLAWDVPAGTDVVSSLDVSVLQDRFLAPVLGIDDPRTSPRISFMGGVRGLDELSGRVDQGHAAVAFSMYPVTVGEMMAIADAGAIMPPKSTWFEPKLRSGLFVHVVD